MSFGPATTAFLYNDVMKNIRQVIHDVIEQRVLPWIEQDGISNLLLPEQITPEHCARPIICRRPFLQLQEHELVIGLTGSAMYCIDHKRVIFTPGRIMLVPDGVPHCPAHSTIHFVSDLDPAKLSSTLWMRSYPSGVWTQIGTDLGDGEVLEATSPVMLPGPHFSSLMTSLLEEIRSKQLNYKRIARSILTEFMERSIRAAHSSSIINIRDFLPYRLSRPPASFREKATRRREKTASGKISGRVRVALEFIRSNYHQHIGLEDIAEAANSSATHLRRQFKDATGMTPIQYLMDIRMAAAKQLLLTDLKVFEVACLVGIEDHSYFGRLFRKITGVSPQKYRKQTARTAKRKPSKKSNSPTIK